MWLAKGAAAFCYIHQTSCHKDPRRCPCIADRFHTYIQPPPPQITTQGQLVQMYTRAEGHARESRHTLPRRAPMDVCGEWGGTHLAVGGSWCMKWPYNVTAGEREGAIMVFNARKEDISDFCWTNRVASFHGTLTATYSHTPLRLQQQLGVCRASLSRTTEAKVLLSSSVIIWSILFFIVVGFSLSQWNEADVGQGEERTGGCKR